MTTDETATKKRWAVLIVVTDATREQQDAVMMAVGEAVGPMVEDVDIDVMGMPLSDVGETADDYGK